MKEGYFLRIQGVVRGPFSLDQLQTMRTRGQLQRFHEISSDKKKWIAAGSVIELFPATSIPVTEQSSLADVPQDSPKHLTHTGGPSRAWLLKALWILPLVGICVAIAVGVGLFFWFKPPINPDPGEADPKRAVEILRNHCYECHGQGRKGSNKKFDVSDRDALMAQLSKRPKSRFLTPGDPENSAIWKRIENDEMPDAEKKLTEEEKGIIKAWILAGAKFPDTSPNQEQPTPVAYQKILEAIDLAITTNTDQADRRNMRFFVLSHLHNQNVDTKTLKLHKAGVSKLLNSLSKEPEISVPVSLGPERTVLQINLLDYGWDARKWENLVRGYKYSFDEDTDQARDLSSRIRQQTGERIYAIRADWFIANASKPELYHDLLGIPSNLLALEQELKLSRIRNIQQSKVMRAGFGAGNSGVSLQNRVIERHSSQFGYYWISYDFQKNNKRNDIMRFPLGPPEANLSPPDEPELDFDADGGEVIFSLPNKLQGYMLVDKSGGRIKDGPSPVVSDSQNNLKNGSVITNGLSCFACHRDGLIYKPDEVKATTRVKGTAKSIVARLYRSEKELEDRIKIDNEEFLVALKKCYKPFLPLDEAKKEKEPLVFCHQEYIRPLDFKKAAHELGVSEERLKNTAEFGGKIAVGLSALKNGTMERETWEQIFPTIVRDLQLGRPVRD